MWINELNMFLTTVLQKQNFHRGKNPSLLKSSKWINSQTEIEELTKKFKDLMNKQNRVLSIWALTIICSSTLSVYTEFGFFLKKNYPRLAMGMIYIFAVQSMVHGWTTNQANRPYSELNDLLNSCFLIPIKSFLLTAKSIGD